ncbi:MAG: biotin-dependent carboxyltransferase family protein [Bacillota bacterium]|nr:biotin-dependent carboxyltransferase family protein [Bacillota bacterium]
MITILKPGLLTTIQDLGRFGFQKYGVVTSGAMDQLAFRIANLLVGNQENQAGMEITLIGPIVRFETDLLISICGADITPMINGDKVRLFRPIFVKKGSILAFGTAQNGCRAYLAVAGGINVPFVMNSSSTYLRAKIGGFHGRKLKSGDRLLLQSPSAAARKMISKFTEKTPSNQFTEMNWFVDSGLFPKYKNNRIVRVITGREFDLFSKESQRKIFQESYVVTSKSDRMGYRLLGSPLFLEKKFEMLSEAVSFGTIQVPADGNPIVLLADRQTTGGYPRIAQIITVDFPVVAQAKPGDFLSFVRISHEEAQMLYIEREHEIKRLKKAIELKYY